GQRLASTPIAFSLRNAANVDCATRQIRNSLHHAPVIEAVALEQSATAKVRFGSEADITHLPSNVRFTPESGHGSARPECPLCAISGLMHCSKRSSYLIASSAIESTSGGTLTPSARAVCRLMADSKLVDCVTRSSAGFSPRGCGSHER